MTYNTLSLLTFLIMMQLVAIGWHWKSEAEGSLGHMVLAILTLVLLVLALIFGVPAKS